MLCVDRCGQVCMARYICLEFHNAKMLMFGAPGIIISLHTVGILPVCLLGPGISWYRHASSGPIAELENNSLRHEICFLFSSFQGHVQKHHPTSTGGLTLVRWQFHCPFMLLYVLGASQYLFLHPMFLHLILLFSYIFSSVSPLTFRTFCKALLRPAERFRPQLVQPQPL